MVHEQNIHIISHLALITVICLVGYLHLSVPFLTILFSYLVLELLMVLGKKWLSVGIFIILVAGILYAFSYVGREAAETLPKVAEKSIPIVIHKLQYYGVELPFQDIDSLRPLIASTVKEELASVAWFAGIATKEFVLFLIALVIAISIFVGGKFDLARDTYTLANNLYVALSDELKNRFVSFYRSFHLVMGAQLIISGINTLATGVFVFVVGLPYPHVLVAATFLCGLLPIVGNIISNTIIFCVAITISVQDAVFALLFLIILHKFEYFLNGRIIGGRIGNPMWLTLVALIIGEQIMGIPGMILAPVALYYIKQECSKVAVSN